MGEVPASWPETGSRDGVPAGTVSTERRRGGADGDRSGERRAMDDGAVVPDRAAAAKGEDRTLAREHRVGIE
jgi:hypothetical protein